jgi:hypothetical protein
LSSVGGILARGHNPTMAPRLELYPFRYRDPRTGKWVRSRYVAELHEIAARYAEFEIIGPPEIRNVDPAARPFTPHKPLLDAELRRLSSANIPISITRSAHTDRLRARGCCGKGVFVMQAAEDRFHKDERTRRQSMSGGRFRSLHIFFRRIRHSRT